MSRLVEKDFKHRIIPEEMVLTEFCYETQHLANHIKQKFRFVSNYHHTTYGIPLGKNELRMFSPGLIIPRMKKDAIRTINFHISFDCDMSHDDFVAMMDYGAFMADNSGLFLEVQDTIAFNVDVGGSDYAGILSSSDPSRNLHEIARFFPKMMSLVTSDLPHTDEGLILLDEIIGWLVANTYLDAVCNPIDAEKKKAKVKVKIGCDPELEYINPSGFVSENFPPSIFCDSSFENSGNEEIGLDGGGSAIELRPDPEYAPSKLRNNVYKLMEKIKNHHLSVIGNRFAIGCHLHFGLGKETFPPPPLIKLLDKFLGVPCYSMNGSGRHDYAELGQFREQPHGFEYRSLPAAVMSDPEFFRIVLKVGKQIVERYVNGKVFLYNTTTLSLAGSDTVIPTREAYKRICGLSDTELTYFYNFIDNYDEVVKYEKNVIAFWKIPDAVSYPFKGLRSTRNRTRDEYDDNTGVYDDDDDDTSRPARRNDSPPVQRHINVVSGVRSSMLNLNFVESWSEDIIQTVESHLRTYIYADNEFRERYCEMDANTCIEFIGLREDRGHVVMGFDPPSDFGGSLEHYRISNESWNQFTFGLSRSFRRGDLHVTSLSVYLNALMKNLCLQVISNIYNHLGNMSTTVPGLTAAARRLSSMLDTQADSSSWTPEALRYTEYTATANTTETSIQSEHIELDDGLFESELTVPILTPINLQPDPITPTSGQRVGRIVRRS